MERVVRVGLGLDFRESTADVIAVRFSNAAGVGVNSFIIGGVAARRTSKRGAFGDVSVRVLS
jgi:hypothetical protein